MTTTIKISRGGTSKPKPGFLGAMGMTDHDPGLSVEVSTDEAVDHTDSVAWIEQVAGAAAAVFRNAESPEPLIDAEVVNEPEDDTEDSR